MPMVNATDIPLQPYPTGRTSPQAPSDYQNIQATPAEFGSQFAEAQSGVGKTLEQIGTNLINRAVAQQHTLNLTEQDKLQSQLDDAAHSEKYGDPTAGIDPATGLPLVPGWKNRYGGDAVDYIKSGEPAKRFNDTVNRIASSASNDAVREMFLRQSRSRRAAFENGIDEHWNQQILAQNKQVAAARDYVNSRDIAAGYDDDAIVQSKVQERIINNLRGITDPISQQAVYYNSVYEGVRPAIDAALAADKPARAMQLYEAYKNHMRGEDQLTLFGKIKGPWDRANGTAAGQTGVTGGGAGSTTAAEHYNTAISLGASPNEAALLTSAADAESGFVPTKTHDGGIGYGLYGHNDTRLAAMRAQFGPTPTAAQQIQFALAELRSRPEGARVNAAKTPEELTALQFEFERPKRGPTDQADRRLATTREYMTNPPKARAAASAGGTAGGGVIDKTADAGFGQKFGPLEAPQGMVIHHTAGGKSVGDVIATFKKTGYPAQFVIDRAGKIYQTIPDGYQARHVRDSWGPLGEGKGNANMEGVEIIADNDGDVLPVQQQAAARLVAMRAAKFGYDPKTSVYGHGELNPGHKQADEGMSTVTRIRNGSAVSAPAAKPPGLVEPGNSTPPPPPT